LPVDECLRRLEATTRPRLGLRTEPPPRSADEPAVLSAIIGVRTRRLCLAHSRRNPLQPFLNVTFRPRDSSDARDPGGAGGTTLILCDFQRPGRDLYVLIRGVIVVFVLVLIGAGWAVRPPYGAALLIAAAVLAVAATVHTGILYADAAAQRRRLEQVVDGLLVDDGR
jgi:hypothetical protein